MADTKKRILPIDVDPRGKYVQQYLRWGVPTGKPVIGASDGSAIRSLDGKQITVSENHPGWNARKSGRFNGDLGGEFTSTRQFAYGASRARISGVRDDGFGDAYSYNYDGLFLPCAPGEMQFPPFATSSDDTLDELGATAIARCSPTNPTADLTTFLGELVKEGIPKLTGSVLKKWRNLSSSERRKAIAEEHLNYQFGWKPLVNDVTDLAQSVVHGDRIIDQYTRDSGKLVRRRYDFPIDREMHIDTVKTDAVPWTTPSGAVMIDNSRTTQGKVLRTHEVVRTRWFAGAFTYYIPPRDGSLKTDMARQVILAKKTLGVRLTPDAVWNLTPWSWAFDWFTNAGDVLKNLDAWIIDGQVLAYGYMMEHVLSKYTYTFVGKHNLRTNLVPFDVTLVSESKVRRKATPYGFGLDWDGFNPTQWSVLAALGITKSHK